MARLGRRRRTCQAAKCVGEAQGTCDPTISEWDLLTARLFRKEREPPESKHPSTGRKETNRDALSKGDRRGYRANRSRRGKAVAVWCSDSGTPDLANSNSGGTARLERLTASYRYAGKVIRGIESSVARESTAKGGGVDIQLE